LTKPSGKHVAHVAALLSLALSGCVTWTGPVGPGAKAGSDRVPLPSEQYSPLIRGAESASSATGTRRAASTTPAESKPIVRGQQPEPFGRSADDDRYSREPLSVSGAPIRGQTLGSIDDYDRELDSGYAESPMRGTPARDAQVAPAQYAPPQYGGPPSYGAGAYDAPPSYSTAPSGAPSYGGPSYGAPSQYAPPAYPPAGPGNPYGPPGTLPGNIGYANPAYPPGPEFQPGPTDMPGQQPFTGRFADLIVNVREQQTGRFMFGVGVNSDAGLTAQIVIDEYNFDWRRFPRSVDEIIDGTAWRGAGQRLRIEAIPGSQLQRYLVNFTEPYLFDTNISLNLSGFLYDRQYFDWDEQRLGGRIGLGYRLTPDLSLTTGLRMENVNINDPRVRGVPELEEVIGDSSLFSGRVALTHDTRDSPFAATEGHFLEVAYEQTFGTFDYPRGNVDYRRYFLLHERPDGSGRHVLGASLNTGISGGNTPLYENFFAGGYSTIRGFRFRSANPKSGDVYVGGELSLLGSAEYMFPITADDMLKGVVFCDYGTIEEELKIEMDDFRVAVGAGLRIAIPAMGPAPIAVDFAVPIAREQTDRVQNFSFFVGFGR
jgi:outer membrane protein insertion porin family